MIPKVCTTSGKIITRKKNIFFFCVFIDATVPSDAQPGPSGRVELRVGVSPDVIQVRRGQTVELTCTVYGGDQHTNIYWIQDEPERVS